MNIGTRVAIALSTITYLIVYIPILVIKSIITGIAVAWNQAGKDE